MGPRKKVYARAADTKPDIAAERSGTSLIGHMQVLATTLPKCPTLRLAVAAG